MPRAVLDTSCLVSYLLTAGDIMHKVVAHWRAGTVVLLSSPALRTELGQVLNRPAIRARSTLDLDAFVRGYERFTEYVPPPAFVPHICRDPKDDMLIACAVAGRADYLVSSDLDLLSIRRHADLPIVNPGQFLVAVELFELDTVAIAQRFSPRVLSEILEAVPLDNNTDQRIRSLLHRGQ